MPKRIGIVGGGALGSLLARGLSGAGARVQVLTRSPERRVSLKRETPALEIVDDAAALAGADLVFVCVKAYDTRAAATSLRAHASPPMAVCSLQNGWGHMEALEEALESTPLVAGTTALGAFLDEDGMLRTSTAGPTLLAPWTADAAARAGEVATALHEAGFAAEIRPDARAILWRKLILNVAVNPTSALLDRPNGALLESAGMLRVAEAAALEATRVGMRLGHVDAAYDPRAALHELLRATSGNRSSMAEDLARGRRTEAEAILGAVAREARALPPPGEPVPVIEALLQLILAAERHPGPGET